MVFVLYLQLQKCKQLEKIVFVLEFFYFISFIQQKPQIDT